MHPLPGGSRRAANGGYAQITIGRVTVTIFARGEVVEHAKQISPVGPCAGHLLAEDVAARASGRASEIRFSRLCYIDKFAVFMITNGLPNFACSMLDQIALSHLYRKNSGKQRKAVGTTERAICACGFVHETRYGGVESTANPTDMPVIGKVNACIFPAEAGGAGRHAPSRVAIRGNGHSGAARRLLPGTGPPGPAARGRNLWTPASGKWAPGSPFHGALE
jgi:hypothetical protein